jgi:tetratricopeptide (TPR) repeat protein
MQRFILSALAVALLATAARPVHAQAFDSVKRAEGTIRGKITSMSPVLVKIEKNGVEEEVPVNEVESITFTDEPSELSFGRIAALNGRYKDALESLNKIDMSKIERAEIKQDIEFYKALSAAKLALGGDGSIAEAGKQMYAFESQNKSSYHYLEAAEVLGDLLVALKKYPGAVVYYDKLSKVSWPEYKMRSGVLVGRALQAQNKHAEALARFDQVLALEGKTPEANMQKLAATLGKAVSLAAGGKVPEALKMVQTVIRDANPENVELQARAYNALGNCYLQDGKTKDALLAFLHTDVLYNTFPAAHAEALARLAQLWNKVGNADRSREAAALLNERYPASVWAQQ